MQFSSFSEFLAMGGYGFYVWLSFGVSALLLIALVIVSQAKTKQLLKQIKQQQQRTERLKQAAEMAQKATEQEVIS